MMAEDTIELIDHLGWKKVNICGFSMGSFICLELLNRHPDRINSAVLGGCSSGYFFPSWQVFKLMLGTGNSPNPSARFLHMSPVEVSDEFLDNIQPKLGNITGREYLGQDVNKTCFHTVRFPMSTYLQQSLACFTHFVSAKQLKKIKETKIPVLSLHGTEDKV